MSSEKHSSPKAVKNDVGDAPSCDEVPHVAGSYDSTQDNVGSIVSMSLTG